MIYNPFRMWCAALFFVLSSAASVIAQPAIPVNPPTPEAPPVPLTGVEWLLIAGGAMGGYKLFKKKNAQDTTDDQ